MKVIAQNKPLYEQAYEIVKKSILTGEFKTGSKIVMVKLAEELQISRTPLREALRQLQNEGLLNIDKNGVITVIEIDKEDFDELCQCRLALEKEIVIHVVENITDEQLAEVDEILKEAERAINHNEQMELLSLNAGFHEKLIRACHNKRLLQLLEQVRSLLLIYRANIHKHSKYNEEIVNEHRQIYEAVKSRDISVAIKVVEQHLLNDKMRGRKMFEDQG